MLLDNLEILLDPALRSNRCDCSRCRAATALSLPSWNGSYRDGTLTYAEPGHPEFIQFKQTDAVVIPVGTNETK